MMAKGTKKNLSHGRKKSESPPNRSRSDYAAEQQEREAFLDRMNVTDPKERELYARACTSELDLNSILASSDPVEQLFMALALVEQNKGRINRVAHALVPERTSVRDSMRIHSKAMEAIFKDRDDVLGTLHVLGKMKDRIEADLTRLTILENEFLVHLARLNEKQRSAIDAIDPGLTETARLLELHGLLRTLAGPDGAVVVDEFCEFLTTKGHGRPVDPIVKQGLVKRLKTRLVGDQDRTESLSADTIFEPSKPTAINEMLGGNDPTAIVPEQVDESVSEITNSADDTTPRAAERAEGEHAKDGVERRTSPSDEPLLRITLDEIETMGNEAAGAEENTRHTLEADAALRPIAAEKDVPGGNDAAADPRPLFEKQTASRGGHAAPLPDVYDALSVSPELSQCGGKLDHDTGNENLSERDRGIAPSEWFDSEFATGAVCSSRPSIPAKIDERDAIPSSVITMVEGRFHDPDLWLRPDLGGSGLRVVQRKGKSPLLPSYNAAFLPPGRTLAALASTAGYDPVFRDRVASWDDKEAASDGPSAPGNFKQMTMDEVEILVEKAVRRSVESARMFETNIQVDQAQLAMMTRFWMLLIIGGNRPELLLSLWGGDYFDGVHGHDPGLGNDGYLQVVG